MKHYIDCGFDGFGGQLLSMALVSETERSMYAVMNYTPIQDPWVLANVHPIMLEVPQERIDVLGYGVSREQLAVMINEYFKNDAYPHVVADWPDDLKYLCEVLITGPGTMIDLPGIKMSVKRVDAYPSTLIGAVQHNAWWDAMALRHMFRPQDMPLPLNVGSIADELTQHKERDLKRLMEEAPFNGEIR